MSPDSFLSTRNFDLGMERSLSLGTSYGRVFDESWRTVLFLVAVDWRVESVPILGVLRNVPSSRLESISVEMSVKEDEGGTGVVVWNRLAGLRVKNPNCWSRRGCNQTSMFQSLTQDSFPSLRKVSFSSLRWEKEFPDFLVRCIVLEVLEIACSGSPRGFDLPSFDLLHTVAVSTKLVAQVFRTHLPRLRTLVLVDYRLLFCSNEDLRHTRLSQLSHALRVVLDRPQGSSLERVMVRYSCAEGLASLVWMEDASSGNGFGTDRDEVGKWRCVRPGRAREEDAVSLQEERRGVEGGGGVGAYCEARVARRVARRGYRVLIFF